MSIFLNTTHAYLFERDGYFITPLLRADELQALQRLYDSLPPVNASFFSTSAHPDLVFKKKLDAAIRAILQPRIATLLGRHKPLGTAFLIKKNAPDSAMPLHQDWTVTDESKYFSATVWIPLCDATVQNGAMQVISGSHVFSTTLRSPTLGIELSRIQDALQPHLKLLPMKAGDALVFRHALMHASLPNLSEAPRVAVTYGFMPPEAPLFFYVKQDDHLVAQYTMPDDMFLRYPELQQRPEVGTLIRTFSYDPPDLSLNQIEEAIYNHRKFIHMKPLFKNPDHQRFFEENGYIVLPALDEERIHQLRQYYHQLGLKDEWGFGFHVGMDVADKQRVKDMVHTIKSIALPAVAPYLHEVQLFTASFVIKEPNPKSVVPPHQDWTFVEDELNYCSVTCWIPLQDVTIENGCMGVIKGSHRFFSNVRPSPSPQVATPLKSHMFTLFPYLHLIYMKAGEALIFDNRTIHASPPNTTSTPRVCVGLGFTQKEATICHYYLKPGTDQILLKYRIAPDFFLKYDNYLLSKMYDQGETIKDYGEPEELIYTWEDLSPEELVKRITMTGNTYNGELVNRISHLLQHNGQTQSTSLEEQAAVATPGTQPQAATEKTTHRKSLPFWKIYTPANIIREVKYRLTRG